MTSSQPVTTPNAINFTPDNLHCYGYSGVVNCADSEINLIQFDTNSEYIVGTWFAHFNQPSADGLASEDFRFILYMNDIQIAAIETSDSQGSSRNTIRDIIIPPFTTVKITARNYTGSTTEPVGVVFTGQAIGMTETGFQ